MEILLFSEMTIPQDASVISILLLGLLFGLQHAIEADHLAAVSAIVSDRKSIWSSTLVGGLWGVGHTISLFLVGVLVIFLKLQIGETTEGYLEAVVGLMLVLLGLNAFRKLWKGEAIHAHTHDHEGHKHLHIHSHDKSSEDKTHHKLSPRSVFVGMVHGLAGSAALMLLVVPTISSPYLAMAYILVFGVGSIGGMMVMSFIIGLPFHFTANNFNLLNRIIKFAAGTFSFCLGLFIIYEKLFAGI